MTFCDASGLAVLVGAATGPACWEVSCGSPPVSPPTARVLHITGLHRHLSIYPTVHAATAAPGDGFGRAGALAAA